MKTFLPGTVVVFEPSNLNPDFWNNLPEKERLLYYGPFGYGQEKMKLFIYVCDILNANGNSSGHCVLLSFDGQMYPMCHPEEFRQATDDEF